MSKSRGNVISPCPSPSPPPSPSIQIQMKCLQEVDKKGDGYVLKSEPTVRVNARAHKMSKSRGNVINPDDVIKQYGADSLRLYEMFMGPLRDVKVGRWDWWRGCDGKSERKSGRVDTHSCAPRHPHFQAPRFPTRFTHAGVEHEGCRRCAPLPGADVPVSVDWV